MCRCFSTSTVAVRVDTGEIVWSHQGTPYDSRDLHGSNGPIPLDLT